MARRVRAMVKSMKRWAAYCLLTASLITAVLLRGGVYPQQWQWIALAISAAALLCVSKSPAPQDRWASIGFTFLGLLVAWMAFSMVPLPPGLVAHLSPDRWSDVMAARSATGEGADAWIALSYAPSATFERLLDVLPAIAAFLAVREMGWWWRGRAWVMVAPLVFVALVESVLGLAQFYFARMAGGVAAPATGTYINRNHFAGLLEIAFPLAAMWALDLWRRNRMAATEPARAAWRIAALVSITACLLAGIVVSLSRMGFFAAIGALALLTATLVFPRIASSGWNGAWKWLPTLAIPIVLVLALPTTELKRRLADTGSVAEMSTETRVAIWRDTLRFISGHKLTGSGLGAYERGMYRYKTVKPTKTLDYAHNDYLQVLAELGIPGLLVSGALVAWIVREPLRVVLSAQQDGDRELCAGLLGAFAAIALHSLTDFNLYIPANALAVAWLGGLAVSPGLREGSPSSESDPRSEFAEAESWSEFLPEATTNQR